MSLSHKLARAAYLGAMAAIVAAAACSHDVEKIKREYVERGDRYMQERNIDAAIIEYRNAVQRDPRFVEAYRKLSGAYVLRNEGPNALRNAVTAADLALDLPEVQIEAGNLLLVAGRFADAKARAERAMGKDASNVQARILLGNATAGLKDIDTAIQEFEGAIRLDPSQISAYTSLATLKASKGDQAAAEENFKRAIERDPKSVLARLGLAQFYWSTARAPQAEQTMKEALAVAPTDQRANLALAVFYQYTGRSAEAEPFLRAAVAAKPNAGVTISLADYYIAHKRFDEAIPLLEGVGADPQFGSVAKMRLASIARQQGRFADAMKIVEQALAKEPKSPPALVAKSDLLRQQHKLDEALETIDQAAAADQASAEAQFLRGRILAAQGRPEKAEEAFNEVLRLNPRAAAAQVEIARLNLRSGAIDDSVAMAAQAAKTEPNNLAAQLTLARGYMARRDFARARATLDAARQAAPESASVQAQLGSLLAMQRDAKSARAAFTRALSLDYLQMEALGGLTALDLAAKRPLDAIGRLDRLLDREPKNPALLLLTARACLAVKNLQRAEELLLRAIDLDPEALPAFSMLGRLYLFQNRLDSARGQFEKIAGRQERPIGALTLIGMIEMEQKNTAAARQAFERVLSIDSQAGVAANNLAWIYSETGGNLDRALQLAQTAKAALPNQAAVHDTLGWIYFQKDELSLAIPALQRSVELDPANATSVYHLGLAYEKSGNKDKARRALEAYLKLESTSERSAEVRRRLVEVGD